MACKMNTIIVYNYTGKKVIDEQVVNKSHQVVTSQLKAGIYISLR